MSGENLATQASPSAGDQSSTELTQKEKHREYMKAYMRSYRKKRRLEGVGAQSAGENASSGPPDAA